VNGAHDLGGTDGLGPVEVSENEPVWRAEWEKAAFALFPSSARAGLYGVDAFRYGIEQMHPATYLLSPSTSTGCTPPSTTRSRPA
jgi:nitrile hydratase